MLCMFFSLLPKVFKFPTDGVKEMTEQDEKGEPDILQLNDFSEESLLHTLRVRYERVSCC